ncbi:MAG: hypothetical protein DMF74_14030 [Acidobacteria bacterium]|nr:MAG: hypothetical protein DMF74_14030 [Acidobacteriota bacterium]
MTSETRLRHLLRALGVLGRLWSHARHSSPPRSQRQHSSRHGTNLPSIDHCSVLPRATCVPWARLRGDVPRDQHRRDPGAGTYLVSFAGSLVIAGGAALVVSALVYFRSWRFRATVDKSHQLATGGPFRILRHPIYMGLNLLALGSALWMPTAIVWAAFVLMAIGSDLRARAEETVLKQAFGPSYREYCVRTRRFIPGIY